MMAHEQPAVLDAGTRDDQDHPPAPRPRRSPRRLLLPLLVAALLAQMAVAMVTTAVAQTPTIDEPVYVGTAADYLREHRLRLNPEHPPLGKLVIAAGVALADPHVDTGFRGDQGAFGRHLLYESGNDPWRLMLWARLPVIALTLLCGLVVFAFAREVAGAAAGAVALALYTFSPDLVAHGSLATLDVPAAGLTLTSVWLLWRARERPRPWPVLVGAGAAFGAAAAVKMSVLPAFPVVLALAAVSVSRSGAPRGRAAGARAARGTAVVAVAAVAVVWLSYLAVDPLLRWSPGDQVPAVHGLRGLLVDLMPFPEAYRDGMRVQFGLENRPWEGFLFGRLYTGSLWYYLPAALLVKTPLGMLALWAAGAVVLLRSARLRPAAPYVLVPPAVLLLAAMQGTRDFGTRYALFVPMFLAVAAGCVLVARARWAVVAAGALVLCTAVSSVRTYPFYLPYSNEAFGGPAQTRLRLHDSNVDWGQDLGRLADRLRERYPGERVWLVYKGSGVPSYYGIDAGDPRTVPVREVHGLLVVSDSAAAKARGRLAELLDSSRPIDDVGHSITVYRR
ncbi:MULTISPECIES: phospholipid carrier-dependent glycosyltransferase [Streptomyces]|uniref:Phospholipid carrier-dependent glycosyltransferase n=1 Tax=Streptomyces doudnae TaxID=3075536 RepID=A0ABD5EGP3_9ACTN|nr:MULTISPECIES: phospholipid carrier-dependent glycosyltransferase [unclassified Streptomyces]MDT0433832.1 phospholipid carrier-dependent glycosyltransferase [Streptomyces sp. DSM 41981]SCE13074.1 Dolichyl-phosphate-mannose-protein mannosyltransferase [Streptomyces sp. SolWspMP-5a-2]